jgi:hypothetical protein
MKRYNVLLLCAFISAIVCFSACTNSTAIGSGLLDSDRQDIQFSEDFVMQTATTLGDSVLTFNPILSSQLTDYLVGEYQDPIFGKVRSSVYTQVSTSGAGKPSFDGNILDSVVLVLPYRMEEEYGNINTQYSIDILRIDDAARFGEFDNPYAEVLWSNETFMTESTPIGSISFVPNSTDTITIESPNNDSLGFFLDTLAPQLRIRLEDDFASELFNTNTNNPEDSIFFSDDKFTAFFNGMHINPTSENEGLIDFGLRSNSDAGIFVYYHTDTTDNAYQFPFAAGDLKFPNYKHDYTGSIAETFVNEPTGDSLFFLHGLAGVNSTLEFPNLDNLRGDIAINKAELIFTVADLPEDLDIYELPSQIFLTEIDAAGELAVIEDAFIPAIFGGELTEYTDRPATYSMTITAHLQNFLKGSATNDLGVVVLGRERSPNRVVFYGGGHSTYPVKLLVHYTQF